VINGQEAGLNTDGLSNMGEVIELLKSMIDPEHIITSILLDGRELTDEDWNAHASRLSTSILEVETGRPREFAKARLAIASDIVRSCFMGFREARKCFQDGDMQSGNQNLIKAVNTLQAFFQWYSSILQLLPEEEQAPYRIEPHVERIGATCKRICQQQLYQSWWALGETIKNELEPELDNLEDFCRNAAKCL